MFLDMFSYVLDFLAGLLAALPATNTPAIFELNSIPGISSGIAFAFQFFDPRPLIISLGIGLAAWSAFFGLKAGLWIYSKIPVIGGK